MVVASAIFGDYADYAITPACFGQVQVTLGQIQLPVVLYTKLEELREITKSFHGYFLMEKAVVHPMRNMVEEFWPKRHA